MPQPSQNGPILTFSRRSVLPRLSVMGMYDMMMDGAVGWRPRYDSLTPTQEPITG